MMTLTNEDREIVVLTDAEIELIRIKREEEALALQKKEAQKKADLERYIKNNEAEIVKEIAKGEAQVIATQEFYKQFPQDQFMVKIVDNDKAKNCYGESTEVIWSKKYTTRCASIVSKAVTVNKYTDGTTYTRNNFVIAVEKHMTSLGRWSRGEKDNGYKMHLSGVGIEWAYERKFLKNVKTVLAKIEEVTASANRVKQAKADKQTTAERLLSEMTAKYPNAKVSIDTSTRGYNEYASVVDVEFPNGVKIVLKAWGKDDAPTIEKIVYPVGKDQDLFIDELSKMKLVVKENK